MASGRKRRQRRARLTEVKSLERNTPPGEGSQPSEASQPERESTPGAKPVESEVMFGDGGLHAGKGNMVLAQRAFRERWPMTEERRAMLLDQMFGIVERSPDPRNKIAAAKVIVTADSINVNQQKIDTPKESNVNLNVSGGMAVGVSVGAVTASLREQMLNDDRYLDYLRLSPSDGNACPVREDGEPGPVEDGEALGGA